MALHVLRSFMGEEEMDRRSFCVNVVCVRTCVCGSGNGCVLHTPLHPEAQRAQPCFLPWACGQRTHQPVVSGTLRGTTLDQDLSPDSSILCLLRGSHRLSPHGEAADPRSLCLLKKSSLRLVWKHASSFYWAGTQPAGRGRTPFTGS